MKYKFTLEEGVVATRVARRIYRLWFFCPETVKDAARLAYFLLVLVPLLLAMTYNTAVNWMIAFIVPYTDDDDWTGIKLSSYILVLAVVGYCHWIGIALLCVSLFGAVTAWIYLSVFDEYDRRLHKVYKT